MLALNVSTFRRRAETCRRSGVPINRPELFCSDFLLPPVLAALPCSRGQRVQSRAFKVFPGALWSETVHCICSWSRLCAFGADLGSDGRLVAVERRDVKHVAVGADPDRLHLAVPRQRSRMRRAAGAEDLSTAPTVVLPADDGEGSLAGDAGVAGVVRNPVGRVFELSLPGFGCQF